MNFDGILKQIGEFGTYQKRVYFMICITFISSGFQMFISVFLFGTPNHRCAIPGYSNDTYEIQNDYHAFLINFTIPVSSDDLKDYSRCEMYNVSLANTNTVEKKSRMPCHSWVYDKSVFLSTFTEQENLVCDNKVKTTISKMMYFCGLLVGSVGFGFLSDKVGRKKTFFLSIILLLGSTIGLPWVTNFSLFCVSRLITGASDMGQYMTGFVIGMELVGPTKRVTTGMAAMYFLSSGVLILAGIAYGLRDWFYIQITCAVPYIFYLLLWWFVPESTRWLISKHRYEEANKIVMKAAVVNKVNITNISIDLKPFEKKCDEGKRQICTSCALLMRTLIIFFNWMAASVGFYGLAFNSENQESDFYLNFFLQGLMIFASCPICQFLLDRTGRKPLYCTAMILGGLCCICTSFTVYSSITSLYSVTMVLVMLGRLGITVGIFVMYIWSSELFPTVVRNSGMGLSSTFARVGGMLSPFVADLSKLIPGSIGKLLPSVIFGISSILGGCLALILPETVNIDLPETFEDAKEIGTKVNRKIRMSPRHQEDVRDPNFVYTTKL